MENEMDKWIKEQLAEARKFQSFKDAAQYANDTLACAIWENPKNEGGGYIVTSTAQTEAACRAGYKKVGTRPNQDNDDIDEIEEI